MEILADQLVGFKQDHDINNTSVMGSTKDVNISIMDGKMSPRSVFPSENRFHDDEPLRMSQVKPQQDLEPNDND